MKIAKFARAIALAGLLAPISGARADEEKVALKDVPRAVMDSLKKAFPKAEIVEAEKETEDGKVSYEVELKDGEKSVEVALKADGTILEVETEVAAKDLPKAVTAALLAKYPGSTIEKAEQVVTFEGGEEKKAYEVELTTAAKKEVEVRVSPEGKVGEPEDD
ncbi:PepSY-like domain-containing protein [Isosphaeraceae bacterium EP7]